MVDFKYKKARRGISMFFNYVVIMFVLLCSGNSFAFRGGTDIDERGWTAIGQVGSCSATLISYDRVLTAAHCICKSLQNGQLNCYKENVRVRMTDHQRREIELYGKAFPHPDYGKISGDISMRTDLAVIMLDEKSKLIARNMVSQGLYIISLENPNWYPQPGQQFKLIGWGKTGSQCQEGWRGKNELNLPVARVEPPLMHFFDTAKYACGGDSGGRAISPWTHVAGVMTQGWAASGRTTCILTAPYYNWVMGPH